MGLGLDELGMEVGIDHGGLDWRTGLAFGIVWIRWVIRKVGVLRDWVG